MDLVHEVLNVFLEATMLILEYVGIAIIFATGITGVRDFIRKDPKARLNMANGFASGLEFKLGSEIVRTVQVRDLHEIAIVACIIALRAALTLLIYWEIKHEEMHQKELEQEEMLKDELKREEHLLKDLRHWEELLKRDWDNDDPRDQRE